MKSRINYDIMVGGKNGKAERRITITSNEEHKSRYGWTFWWIIVSILVFGILFILAIKKGLI